jgi:SAM-dependent methyltransferase
MVVDASHFDNDAIVYESGRAGWPDSLVEDIVRFAAVDADDTVLEVGAGTGKLTTKLVSRGFAVEALEPSAPMAAILRSKVAKHPRVAVHESTFEEWQTESRYKLACAAASWHWVRRESRVDLAIGALRPGGSLALCWNYPKLPDLLRGKVEEAYATHAPGLVAREPNGVRPPPDQTADVELTASGRFETVELRQHHWTEHFSSGRYVDLLRQSVAHQRLPDPQREDLLRAIGKAIDAQGGDFELPHSADLVLARTRA